MDAGAIDGVFIVPGKHMLFLCRLLEPANVGKRGRLLLCRGLAVRPDAADGGKGRRGLVRLGEHPGGSADAGGPTGLPAVIQGLPKLMGNRGVAGCGAVRANRMEAAGSGDGAQLHGEAARAAAGLHDALASTGARRGRRGSTAGARNRDGMMLSMARSVSFVAFPPFSTS